MKLTNIASLDPLIRRTGRTGLVGASKADKAMWDEMTSNWERFSEEAQTASEDLHVELPDATSRQQDAELDTFEENYEGQSRATTVMARVGQTFFREAVLSSYGYRCCITGLTLRSLLIASHIVPWSRDTNNRLNPRNGLCLSVMHDRAFDNGLMTFSEDFRIMLSEQILRVNNQFLNANLKEYEGMTARLPTKFLPDPAFLSFHRQEIFHEK